VTFGARTSASRTIFYDDCPSAGFSSEPAKPPLAHPMTRAHTRARTGRKTPHNEPQSYHRRLSRLAFDQGGPDATRGKPKAKGSEWP
jgi:hypothetical protein